MVKAFRIRCYICTLASVLLPVAADNLQTQCPCDRLGPLQYRDCPLAFEDVTRAGLQSPWTHPPHCITSERGTPSNKICVYTSSTFNQNKGLSIITTPETAASIFDSVREPLATYRNRRHLAENHDDTSLSYAVKDIPNKGRGVVAARNISQFEVIMVGFPAIIVDDDLIPRSGAPPEGTSGLFQLALERLGDPERVVSLAQSMGTDMHVVEDVVRTNAFGISINGRGQKALFPEVAVSRPEFSSC